ncbi:hypothetical protein D3C71_1498410 [compost metagenome]
MRARVSSSLPARTRPLTSIRSIGSISRQNGLTPSRSSSALVLGCPSARGSARVKSTSVQAKALATAWRNQERAKTARALPSPSTSSAKSSICCGASSARAGGSLKALPTSFSSVRST